MNKKTFEDDYQEWLIHRQTTLSEQADLLADEFWSLPFWSADNCIYIEISLIRSQLLMGLDCIAIAELFNEKHFFGGLIAQHTFALPVFLSIFQHSIQQLAQTAKKYMGKIPFPLVEQYVLQSFSDLEAHLATIYAQKKPNDLINKTISLGQYRRFQYEIF